MILAESLITPPELEPVTAAEIRKSARVDDDRFDDEIDRLIPAARETAEQETGRRLVAQTWRAELDAWPTDGAIPLPQSPVISVTTVDYWDGADWATVDPAVYRLVQVKCQLAEIRLAPGQSWPTLGDEVGALVRVDYVAGYGEAAEDVPAGVRQWIIAHAVHWVANPAATTDREAPPNPYLARLLDRTRFYG